MSKPNLVTKRNPTSIELPPELRARLDKIAKRNGVPRSMLLRLSILHGLSLAEQKIADLRAVPAKA